MKKLIAAITPYLSKLVLLVPVIAGAAILYWSAVIRPQPERLPEQEVARSLRVLELRPISVTPRAIGYGESQVSQFFQAIAEVKGKVIELHPELKAGSFIREGELLVAIDPTDTQIAIQKLEAEIERSKASLAELNASQENLVASLKIEQRSLAIAKDEYERMKRLKKQSNAVSASELDQQRRSVLTQQQAVQSLNSSLNLLPAQIKSAEATMQVSAANLASSKRDLARCRIVAPFTCRLGPVDLELNEFVPAGAQLLTAQSIDKIEVEAQFSVERLSRLVRPDKKSPKISADPTLQPQQVLRTFFDIESTVRYGASGIRTSRQARFERLREELDVQSRTVGIVVSIEKPYDREGNARTAGPPPVPGTYCEVELRAKPLPDSLVVPRASIRDAMVHVVDGENRLRRKKIRVDLIQNSFAVVAEGLNPGDRVVVSDPTPAIEGMLVAPVVDSQLAAQIEAEASPQGAAR